MQEIIYSLVLKLSENMTNVLIAQSFLLNYVMHVKFKCLMKLMSHELSCVHELKH